MRELARLLVGRVVLLLEADVVLELGLVGVGLRLS